MVQRTALSRIRALSERRFIEFVSLSAIIGRDCQLFRRIEFNLYFSEERIALTPRVTQPSDRRATPCAQADSPPMRRLRVTAAWPPRSSADRSASIRRAGLRQFS